MHIPVAVLTAILLSFLCAPKLGATPIIFEGLAAYYTFTETATTTNPSGASVTEAFNDDTLTKSPMDLGIVSSLNPHFSGLLGHTHGNNSLILKAWRRVEAGNLEDNRGSEHVSADAAIRILAAFKVDGDPDTLFDVFETDSLKGSFLTTVDLSINASTSSANVRLSSPILDRRYLQDAAVDGTTLKVGHQIVRERPQPRETTDIIASVPEFLFGIGDVASQINFMSSEEFLTRVRGQQLFALDATLLVEVFTRKTNAIADSSFYSTALINLRAEPVSVSEPGGLGLLGFGLVGIASRRRRKMFEKGCAKGRASPFS